MFKAFYNSNRFRYIHRLLDNSDLFEIVSNVELIPKTACFFSENLDVYIDTSDGVNDDLCMQEYCGRMLSCIRISKGKKFLYLKCAHSLEWSKALSDLAKENNGEVKPFFKFSFNDDFYRYLLDDLSNLRNLNRKTKRNFDIGIFADFNKVYSYPHPSTSDPRISWSDHGKFSIDGSSKDNGSSVIQSRPNMLRKLKDTGLNLLIKAEPYQDYIKSSMLCRAAINPPGIGEYTSRMMDQTAIGNVIILRKNSYDQGNSWKEYLPEVDFNSKNYLQDIESILNDFPAWQEKSRYYYDNYWTPKAVFDYLIDSISQSL